MPLNNPFGAAMGAPSGASDTPAPSGARPRSNPFQSFGDFLRSKQRPNADARKARVKQTAEAQYNAIHQRLAMKRQQGPNQAPLGGGPKMAAQQAPQADEAVGQMQSFLQAGMEAPKQEG